MKRLALLLTVIVANFNLANGQWYAPQNANLTISSDVTSRFDDIYFLNKDTGFTISPDGYIYKTYDGGNNWIAKLSVPFTNTYFRSIEFSTSGKYGIVGSVNGSAFRSVDSGETWSDISANIPDTGFQAKEICGLAHWGNAFYGVGWWGSSIARFYKSNDAGMTWTTSYVDTSLASGLVDIVCLSADTILATGFHLTPDSTLESVVLKTIDTGHTWIKVFGDTIFGGRIWKIQFLDNNIGFGSIEPVYHDTVAFIKTTDGGNTWQLVSAGHKASYFFGTQGIGFATPQVGWIGGYYSGLLQTMDGGQTWDTVNTGSNYNRFFKINDSTMYASGFAVYKLLHLPSPDTSIGDTATRVPQFAHILHTISPNPTSGKINIVFDIARQTNVLLQVINVDDKKVYPVTKGYFPTGNYRYSWDGTHMPSGNYIIWLGTDDIPIVQKFVLSH